MQPLWEFDLVDVNGNLLAQAFKASSRTVSFQLSAPASCSFTVPLTSPEAAVAAAGSTYVKAYRSPAGTDAKTLRFYGPVWVYEVQGGGSGNGADMLKITAFDPMKYLAKRFTVATYAATPTDQGAILKALIDTTNADETGIRTSAGNIAASVTAAPDWSASKADLLSIIQDYGNAFNGIDTNLLPIELAGGKIGELHVWNRRGAAKLGAKLGYGRGTIANCAGMSLTQSMDDVANDVLGFSDTVSANFINTTSIAAIRRLFADVSLTDITDPAIMSQQVQGYLAQHLSPTAVGALQVTTTSAAPRLFDDFDLGDTVTAHFSNGLTFIATPRVWGATVQIDDLGVETTSSLDLRST